MKKIFLLLMILTLTGCSYYNDINNLAIVNEIAIEYSDKYNIYIKVISSNQENESKIYNESCNKIIECFSNLNNKLTKKIYLTHLDLLILDKNINNENINEIINYFLNNQSSRNTFRTIMINGINTDLLNTDSIDLINLLDLSNKSNGIVSNITFDEMIKDILNYQISYLPYLKENEIKGMISIYDENKLLSKDESIIINFILNKINNISLLIDSEDYKLSNCETSYSNTNNKLNMIISCNYEGNNKDKLEQYIIDNLNNFIRNNNINYFYYLKDKYGIKGNLSINKNIKLKEINTNTGDYFE